MRLEWSRRALADLDRLHAFLVEKSPRAADEAIDESLTATQDLLQFPALGRPLGGDDDIYRELIVKFSNAGYLILYRFDGLTLEVQAVRHQSEAGY